MDPWNSYESKEQLWADVDRIGKLVRRRENGNEIRAAFDKAMTPRATDADGKTALMKFYTLPHRRQVAILNGWLPSPERHTRAYLEECTKSEIPCRVLHLWEHGKSIGGCDSFWFADENSTIDLMIREGSSKNEVARTLRTMLYLVENEWDFLLDPGETPGIDFTFDQIESFQRAAVERQAKEQGLATAPAVTLEHALRGLEVARQHILKTFKQKSDAAPKPVVAEAGTNRNDEANAVSAA